MAANFAGYDKLYRTALETMTTTTTNWARAFSPTLYFGCNVQDFDTEQGVLNEVGSYGSQLNRILDVLTVLLPRCLRGKELTPDERRLVDRFQELAERADEVASRLQGKPRRGITQAEVSEWLERLRSLEYSDPGNYRAFAAQIREALAAAAEPPQTQASSAAAPALPPNR